MRPIELTMSAFGSYKGTEHIDFTQLGENGIFLISGKTGAGKSTIFDAISFALFGEASGGLRNGSMLRSEYADPQTKTFVKLRFEYAGKEYTVERSLPYERKAEKRKRNEKGELEETTTLQAAAASLSSPNVPPISTVPLVNRRIQEILGINHDQFTKIAMIPQGEFQKLLQSDNDSKQVILRKVFGTERFQKIEETIAKIVTDVEARKKEKQMGILILLESIKGHEGSDLYAAYKQALKDFNDPSTQLEAMIDLIEKLIIEDQSELRAAEDVIQQCQKREADLNALKERVKTNNDEKATRNETRKALDDLGQELQTLRQEQEKNPQRKKDVDSKKGKRVLLEQQLPLYPDYERDAAKLEEDIKNLEERKTNIGNARAEREGLIEEKDQLEAELRGLEGCEVQKEKIIQEGKQLAQLIEDLKELKGRIRGSENALIDYNSAAKALQDQLIHKADAALEYESAHTLFLSAQAGYMAERLIEGKPCPVCGSVHHPSKAVLPVGAPSEEEVNALKARYEQLMKDAEELTGDCAGKKSEFKEKKEQALSQIEKMAETVGHRDYDALKQNDCAIIDTIISSIKTKMEGLREKKQEIEKDCTRLKMITDEILPGTTTKIGELSKVIEDDSTGEEEVKLDAEGKRLAEIRSSLSFDNADLARKAIEELDTEINTLESTMTSTDQKVIDCQGTIREKVSLLRDLDRRIDDELESDVTKIENELADNTRKKGNNEAKKSESNARLLINDPVLQCLNEEKTDYAAIRQELAWKKNLSDTLRGTLSGKEKVELETFVLMSYFDQILNKASLRLFEMSSGQYELVRSETAGNLREKTGLGIAVKDHYSGKTREVSSLSGGESFLASLALALGLSDETQSSSGGIKIDTMFVDEGFGSLSPDVLELALNTLERLAQKGTLIGLISHVESMKNRYRRIDVEKTLDGGSTITIN